MREINNSRTYSSDDCNCCIYTCMPCIGLSIVFEELLKCLCCCYCSKNETQKKKDFKWSDSKNVDLLGRYSGKIYGVTNYIEKEECKAPIPVKYTKVNPM